MGVFQKGPNDTLQSVPSAMVNLFHPATDESDGIPGAIPGPEKGDINKFLRGDGTWADVDLASVENKITLLENTLYDEVESDKGKSIREIAAEETAKIVAGADTSLDTLKEIADWIASHATSAATMNSDINTLKTDVSTLKGEAKVYSSTATPSASNGNNGDLWIVYS